MYKSCSCLTAKFTNYMSIRIPKSNIFKFDSIILPSRSDWSWLIFEDRLSSINQPASTRSYSLSIIKVRNRLDT